MKVNITKITVILVSIIVVMCVATICIKIFTSTDDEDMHITNAYVEDAFGYAPTTPIKFKGEMLPKGTAYITPYDWSSDSLEQLDVDVSSYSFNPVYSDLAVECNLEILKICATYFTVDVNGKKLSPFYVMALSNNETSIRVDPQYTFCAFFPSKYITPRGAADIANMDSTRVLMSAYVFSKVGSDWWTRDRGPCAMNGSFGVHEDSFAKLMGESEVSRFSKINYSRDWVTYTTKDGYITSADFVNRASSEPGDRFNPKDVCLRMSSESTRALDVIQSNYGKVDTRLAMIMLSMYHGAGSLWNSNFKNSKISYWHSGNKAFEYAKALSTDEVYNIIANKAISDVQQARSKNILPNAGISVGDALKIYRELQNLGYIKDVSYYTWGGDFRDGYIAYPIKLMYNFAQLSTLYNGG